MTTVAQRGFAAGEIAPALYGDPNRAANRGGLRTLRNAVITNTGAIQSRPGTQYKGTTKSNAWARLIAVVFDDDQNYLLELGNGYVRFWKDGAQISGTSIGSWANATAYAAGIVITHSAVNYVCLQAHTSNTANDRPNDGTNRADYWYALSGLIYELPTPWTTQAIARTLQFQVDASTSQGKVRFAYNGTSRRQLTRVANAQWVFTVVTSGTVTIAAPGNFDVEILGGPTTPGDEASWCVTAYDAVNNVESLPTSAISSDTAPGAGAAAHTLTWDAVTGATKYRIYRSDDLSVFGLLYETTALTYIDAGARTPALGTNPPEAAADFNSASEYPGVIGAYQQRILLAGSTGAPATVHGSRTGAPDDFTISNPLVDSDAVSWTMVGARVVRPRHFLEVAQRLVLFANTGEFILKGDQYESGILAPGAVNPQRISANGAAPYPAPLEVNDSALYVQARGNVIRDLSADDASSNVSAASAHLFAGYTIPEWCYQQTPHSVLWLVRSDGTLLSLTYQRELNILAWARHDTRGTFESVACVTESGEDAVYVIANRTINGSTVRYIERFATRVGTATTLVCMDAAVSYSGVAITTATGLSHLNGETVSIVGDGVVRASPYNAAYTLRTVSGGSVAIGASCTTVHTGIPFVADVRTLDIDAGDSRSVKEAGLNVKRIGLWTEETGAVWAGPKVPSGSTALTGLLQHPMRDEEEQALAAGTLANGYTEIPVNGRWSKSGSIFLRHVDPSPFTILSIQPMFDAGRS